MEFDPVPPPELVDIDVPPPVVKPDTLPPPAVTELVMPPPEGGVSPGLRWTVLQLLFGPELVDVVLPSEDAELDELLLSA